MRLTHVIESLAQGGAEQALVNLLPEFVRRGHHVEVISLRGPTPLREALEAAGVVVHTLSLAHRWSVAEAVAGVRARVRGRADVIHSHMFFADVYVGLVRLTGGPPSVTTLHNMAYEQHPSDTLWLKAREHLHGVLLRRVFSARTAVSQAVADHHERALRLDRPVVIANALPVARLQARVGPDSDRVRAELDVGHRSLLALVPGRLVPEKGHAVLLDALSRTLADGLPMVVVCAGGGPLQGALSQDVAARGLQDSVRFTGPVSHDRILDLMQVAEVVVLPSISEGLPLALAEALSLGCAVVASDVGGVSTLVRDGETGWLVPPSNPARLSSAIADAARRPAVGVMRGRAGQAHVEAMMSVEHVADRLLDVYERATMEGSAGVLG